ncbi:sugar-binding protein [Tautonia plasticadhaerens]|uniref:sugar-binding protein n=1 Tax=Tautonia plasticadhaerens TaxID=2527974 RepID=UPI0018D24E6D|nr:sugar-binding protein [Tautonia plasticadhaerens]
MLTGIIIDGDLSDWPDTIELHPIRNMLDNDLNYSKNGVEEDELATSPDLSAVFSVAYDPDDDLIYLAVIVRDDRVVVGHKGYWDTDAVEIYLDGLFSNTTIPVDVVFGRNDVVDASEVPMEQYLGVPGEGPVYGITRTSGEDRDPVNPILNWGDIAKTRTRMEYHRDGDVTVYEWALQVFDRYPDRPTDLVPGKRIGFDVVVVDKDVPAITDSAEAEPEHARSAWVSWCPGYSGPRFLNAGSIGELVLGSD